MGDNARVTSKVAPPTIQKAEQNPSLSGLFDSNSEPSPPDFCVTTPEFIVQRQVSTPSSNINIKVREISGDSDSVPHHSNRACKTTSIQVVNNCSKSIPNRCSPSSNKENTSLASRDHASGPSPSTPENNVKTKTVVSSSPVPNTERSNSSGPKLKLKLKLRGVQGALQEWKKNVAMQPVASHKRAFFKAVDYDEDDTDSEIDFVLPVPRASKVTKASALSTRREVHATTASKTKRAKLVHHKSIDDDGDDDAVFDAGDEGEFSDKAGSQKLSLMTPLVKRNKRILDPEKPEHARLIANATKVGAEYYDSDESEIAGPVKDTTKPHLFRNVKWGSYATDYSNDAEFPTEPEFTQFVPGRFELLPNNAVADQKAKLVVKLTDIHGKKRIFANPPPRNWNDQVAITTLNKRTVQQIRRNTHVRFRDVVVAYVAEERKWILSNLTNGKPTYGWKRFVDDFNARFEGKVIEGVKNARPFRSHSSLTKEVERFGAKWYSKGLVPVPVKQGVRKSEKKN